MTPKTPTREVSELDGFLGKKIKNIKCDCVNVVEIEFTDKTELRLEANGLLLEKYVPLTQIS